MAINFLDGITVNSGTSSTPTIVAAGTRPITLTGGAIGSVAIGGSNGGWATGYFFTGYSGTNRGGFGALGNVDALSYYYIGDAYNDTTMVVQPNAGSVGIGTTAPSDGDLTIGTPKLHVAVGGTSGTFNLAARFQSTTADANNTGTSILINSSNDRGLLIKAGRKDGDREVAYFDVVTSIGNTTNMLTMGNFAGAYNVGVGTTTPSQKLTVAGVIKIDTSSDKQMQFARTGGNTFSIEHDSARMYFYNETSNNHTITLLNGGNVGIGNTSPSQKLTVAGKGLFTTGGSTPDSTTSTYEEGITLISGGAGNQRLVIDVSDVTNGGSYIQTRHQSTSFPTAEYALALNPLGGNVGIGTNTPGANLHVKDSSATTSTVKMSAESNHANYAYLKMTDYTLNTAKLTLGTTYGYSTDKDAITLFNGNVGIGDSNPTQKLDVEGNMVFSQRLIANSNQYYVKLGVWSTASTYGIGMANAFTYGALNNDYAMTFCMNNDSDRGFWWGYDGQVKSTGAMSLNMQGKLKVNHSIGLGTANPSATQGRIDASNDIVAYSTSDIRLKDNIKNIDKALDKVNSIQGIEFDWIEKEEVHGNSGHDIGVIAQEIEKILPDVVTTRENGYKAVKYEKIVPLLIEAIKDLSKQVDGLKRLI